MIGRLVLTQQRHASESWIFLDSLNFSCEFIQVFYSSFQVTSAFSLVTFKGHLAAVFYDFDVLFTDWQVGSLHSVIEDLWVIFVLGILFNAQAKVLYLFLWSLSWRLWGNDLLSCLWNLNSDRFLRASSW